MALADALAPLVDLVFPPRCPLCGDGLLAQTGLCSACWNGLVVPGEPACALCQRPFADSVAKGSICAPCLASPPRHDGIAAGTLYNEPSRRLVLAFKHGNRIALAPLLARLMAAKLPFVDQSWTIVPVPLHRWRLWGRGFNQSALLAREIGRLRGGRVIVDALERRKRTPSLGGLGRKARARALAGAIGANACRKAGLSGAKIVLVDDVLQRRDERGLRRRAQTRRSGASGHRLLRARARRNARVRGPGYEALGDPQSKTPETSVPGVLVTKL